MTEIPSLGLEATSHQLKCWRSGTFDLLVALMTSKGITIIKSLGFTSLGLGFLLGPWMFAPIVITFSISLWKWNGLTDSQLTNTVTVSTLLEWLKQKSNRECQYLTKHYTTIHNCWLVKVKQLLHPDRRPVHTVLWIADHTFRCSPISWLSRGGV